MCSFAGFSKSYLQKQIVKDVLGTLNTMHTGKAQGFEGRGEFRAGQGRKFVYIEWGMSGKTHRVSLCISLITNDV